MSADDATIIEQLRYACEVVGFMQEVGHGVPSSLIKKRAEFHRRLFLPQETKDHLRLSDGCNVRGYFGKGGEDLGSCRGVQAEMFKMSKRRLSFMAQAFGQDADLFEALEQSCCHSSAFTLLANRRL